MFLKFLIYFIIRLSNYYICYFCRSHEGHTHGIKALSECELGPFSSLELEEELPPLFSGESEGSGELRRVNSLAGSSTLNHFKDLMDELITYGTSHNSKWLPVINLAHQLLESDNILTEEIVCFILKLRHTLSIRDVP